MLQDIRDNSQGWVSKIIIGAIVAIFALFGVESLIGGFSTLPAVAEINGEEVSDQRLQQESQRLLNSIGGNLDALDQGLLEQIALNQIIEETVLRQSAANASMLISSKRLDQAILDNPNFQINGVFDAEFAARTMQSQFFSIPLYRQELENQMVLSQLVNAVTASNFVTEAELETIAELSGQTRDFRYISIPMGARTIGSAISDEEIENYYQLNQNNYLVDAAAAVEYVVLDKTAIAAEIEVEEEQVRAQYELERQNFEGSAEKRASHILLEIADADEAATIATANTIKQRLDAGESFADLALAFSVDTASAEQGGDIGFTDGSAFPEQIEAALALLSLDEISEPVVSDFGVHIVRLTQDQVNVFQSFEEVSGRIERDLKSADIEQIYAERLEDLSNLAFESGDLSVISEQLALTVIDSEPFSAAGGQGLLANPSVAAAAFSDEVLLEGNNSDVIELSENQAIVLRVKEYTEASVSPLDELRGEIAVALRTEMEREAVQTLGDEFLAAAESGQDVSGLLTENDLEWIDGTGTERTAVNINRQVLNQLFTMDVPQERQPSRSAITLDNGSFILLELNAVKAGEVRSLADAEKENLLNTLKDQAGGSDFQSLLATLKENADIVSSRLPEAL